MAEEGFKRKLTAILSADVVGYSRLMGEDEETTVQTLKTYREVMATYIQQHRGRVVDSPGDNLLAEFSSVVDALDCAVKIQHELKAKNSELPEQSKMQFRIGVNLGDVIDDEERIYGDGVNVAARVEGLADSGGICVSGTAYDQIAKKLPLGYEYLGEQTVKNIEKPVRVYRVLMDPGAAGKVIGEKRFFGRFSRRAALAVIFILVVVAGGMVGWNIYLQQSKKVEPASIEKMAYPLPDKPSIAVLPFENLGEDPEFEMIADGISENIITALSKSPDIFVIARNSTFYYKGKQVKIKQISEELGVNYVLEGSLQKVGSKMRITAQLIDALKGHHIWADKYDREIQEILTIMDEITLAISKELSVKIFPYGIDAGPRVAGTRNLDAWTLFIKGYHHGNRISKENNVKAQELYEKALEIDPNFAAAMVDLGIVHVQNAKYGWSSSPTDSIKQAKALAAKSMEIDAFQAGNHILLGEILVLEGKLDEAIIENKKAIDIDPNDPVSQFWLGKALRWYGQYDEAIYHLKRAMRLNPHYPWYFPYVLGRAYFLLRQYDDSISIFESILERYQESECSPKWPHMQLAKVYAELGQYEKARLHMQKVLELDPNFNIQARRKENFYKDPAVTEREMDALRKAGAPEHPPSQ
jgi:TolB-like protein/class 3 adenylate cyclase/Tfp pilus assembly protein PilF